MKREKWLKAIVVGWLILTLGMVMAGCATSEPEADTAATTQEEGAEAADEHEDTDEHEDAEEVEEAAGESAAEAELEGNAVRGGLLYDAWWAVAEAREAGDEHADEHSDEGPDEHEHDVAGPTDDHPLWASQDSNTRSGSDTWRCKECHGWDYKGVDGAYGSGSHRTGFTGVIQLSGADPNDVLSALRGGTNADHDFSGVMDEQDLIDLSIFITEALIDDDTLIDEDKSSVGDMGQGESLYGEVCILCHGPAGNAINFGGLDDPEVLGHLAPDNPWEFVHKVRFGQPGWPMPSGINNGWTNEDVADVLAYAQTFSTEMAVSGGGQLYDAWWTVIGAEAPAEDHPLWATQSTNERSGADTWRCKECHGWDYMGVDGAYGSGSHSTGFTGVLNTAPGDVMGWLDGSNNPDHDFSSVMEPYALEALVTFMSQEMADITPYVSLDGSVSGDPAHGRDLFTGTCSNCHGVDGKAMNFGDADDPEYVGTVAADNPWEFFHKASFGQPGTPMPAGHALGWTMQDIADLLSYVQTLPSQ